MGILDTLFSEITQARAFIERKLTLYAIEIADSDQLIQAAKHVISNPELLEPNSRPDKSEEMNDLITHFIRCQGSDDEVHAAKDLLSHAANSELNRGRRNPVSILNALGNQINVQNVQVNKFLIYSSARKLTSYAIENAAKHNPEILIDVAKSVAPDLEELLHDDVRSDRTTKRLREQFLDELRNQTQITEKALKAKALLEYAATYEKEPGYYGGQASILNLLDRNQTPPQQRVI